MYTHTYIRLSYVPHPPNIIWVMIDQPKIDHYDHSKFQINRQTILYCATWFYSIQKLLYQLLRMTVLKLREFSANFTLHLDLNTKWFCLKWHTMHCIVHKLLTRAHMALVKIVHYIALGAISDAARA